MKLASAKYYDELPTEGNEHGQAFRDVELEKELLIEAQNLGLGAQFGGKYFAHDIRVIRLPRHGASCPVGMGVSCSADRNIKAKINRQGIWIEKLEHNPGKYIPEELRKAGEGEAVRVDLNRPMKEILAQLSQYPVSTRLSLNGTIIVGRDIAHAKLKERMDNGEGLPQYIKSSDLLRRSGQNAGRLCLRFSWPNDRRTDGFLCRSTASAGRKYDHAGERQPQPAGDGCL